MWKPLLNKLFIKILISSTIAASGGFGLLEIVSESDIGWCASEDAESQRSVDIGWCASEDVRPQRVRL